MGIAAAIFAAVFVLAGLGGRKHKNKVAEKKKRLTYQQEDEELITTILPTIRNDK